MFTSRAAEALDYYFIDRGELEAVCALDYDPVQLQEFLAPVDDIIADVRRGLAHRMIGIRDGTALIGFMVLHPDPRDHACWWLAWFAIDRSHQGRGYGRIALTHAMTRLAHIDGCRRIRLLVAHHNEVARHVYDVAGFDDVGRDDEGWHIMEYLVPSPIPSGDPFAAYRAAHGRALTVKRVRRRMRLRPATGPNPARTLGSVRAPPAGLARPNHVTGACRTR
jgi:diamine N-acetyltransferase